MTEIYGDRERENGFNPKSLAQDVPREYGSVIYVRKLSPFWVWSPSLQKGSLFLKLSKSKEGRQMKRWTGCTDLMHGE